MFFFQLSKGCDDFRLEAVLLIQQGGKRGGVVLGHGEESLLREAGSEFCDVIHRGIYVESFSAVAQPHISAYQTRLPIHLALDHPRDFIVGSLAKNPLLAFELVVPAWKRGAPPRRGFCER